MAYYIGIDGGGSKTECVIGDEERVRGRMVGPSCKVQVVGKMAAQVVLQNVIKGACAQAHTSPEKLSRVCIGVAGYSGQGVAAALTAMVWELAPIAVDVVGDNAIAMEAAFGRGPGVLVISGTGSIAHARDENGRTARVGGWGPTISDEGSGSWIGRRAVATMMRAADRGEHAPFEQKVMELFNVKRLEDVAAIANQKALTDFARLLPDVLAVARAGGHVAASVLNEAGVELSSLAADVIAKLWPLPRLQAIPVAMVGGVFRHSEEVRNAFERELRKRRPDVSIVRETVEPALGALALARRAQAQGVPA